MDKRMLINKRAPKRFKKLASDTISTIENYEKTRYFSESYNPQDSLLHIAIS